MELPRHDLVQMIAYAAKRNRRLLNPRTPQHDADARDREAYRMAEAIVTQLEVCGVRWWKKPPPPLHG